MKALFFIIAVFILIATNPSLEKHQERVGDVVAYCVAKGMGDGLDGKIVRWLQLDKVTGEVTASTVSRVNFLVCSIGMIDDTLVSFGALNCVLVRTDWE